MLKQNVVIPSMQDTGKVVQDNGGMLKSFLDRAEREYDHLTNECQKISFIRRWKAHKSDGTILYIFRAHTDFKRNRRYFKVQSHVIRDDLTKGPRKNLLVYRNGELVQSRSWQR